MDMKFKGPVIGVDLGTTYSRVAVWQEQNNRAEIIHNEQGNRATPCFVAFTYSQTLIGDAAKNQAASNPANTIFDAKRLIGRKYSDPIVQNDMLLWPFKVIAGANDKPVIVVKYKGKEKHLDAEEISSMVVTKMRQIAEAFLETPVKNAVITVPAYFNASQCKATKDAGVLAGLNVIRIINEPIAAALAYGLQKRANCSERKIFIFNLGSRIFDVSLLIIKDNLFDIKATIVDTHLGGGDFDNRMLNHFVKEFKRNHKKDISRNLRALRRLRTACENANKTLSFNTEATIEIDAICEGIDLCSSITRTKFEQLNMDSFKKCMEIVEKCLIDAKMEKSSVDDVVLIGGSSKIPKLQQLLQEFFKGKNLCKSIRPDEAVAYGAAVPAWLCKDIKIVPNTVLQDVSPLSLCTSVFIHQEYVMGLFDLEVPLATSGFHIKIMFAIDADSNLKVFAEEDTTGNKREIIIMNRRLSTEEVERIIKESENFKIENMNKNKVKAMSALEDYLKEMRKIMMDNSICSMLPPFEKMKIKSAIVKGKMLLEGSNQEETSVFVDFLGDLKTTFEFACNKINIDNSDEEGD